MYQFISGKLQTIASELYSELTNSETNNQYRYLLLDMLGEVSELSDIYYHALKDRLDPSQVAIVRRPELEHTLASCPHLICIGQPNENINEKLFYSSLLQLREDFLTSKYYVCGWLSSELPPEKLAEHLLYSASLSGKFLNIPFLAFYEPFRLDVLIHSYGNSAHQLGLLLPKDTRYSFVNSEGELSTFGAIEYQNEQQFSQLFLNNQLNYYHRHLRDIYNLYLLWIDFCERKKQPFGEHILNNIMLLMQQAEHFKLSNMNDKKSYVLFSLQYGDLTRSQKIMDIIKHLAISQQGQLSLLLSQETQELQNLTIN